MVFVVKHQWSRTQSGWEETENEKEPTSFHPAKLHGTCSDLIAHLHWPGELLGVTTGGFFRDTGTFPGRSWRQR